MKAEPRVPSGAQEWGVRHPPLPATEGAFVSIAQVLTLVSAQPVRASLPVPVYLRVCRQTHTCFWFFMCNRRWVR